MKKKLNERLSLSKETLRNLSEREMEGVVGGLTRLCTATDGAGCTDTCPSCNSCPTC